MYAEGRFAPGSLDLLILKILSRRPRLHARLSQQPTGFTAEGVVNVITGARPPQSVLFWEQVAAQLRSVPRVETVALAAFPPLSGSMEGGFVAVNGQPGGALVRFLAVSPSWFDAMKIPFLGGRDFQEADTSRGLRL